MRVHKEKALPNTFFDLTGRVGDAVISVSHGLHFHVNVVHDRSNIAERRLSFQS